MPLSFAERPFLGRPFIAIDFETTGLDPVRDRLLEVAWVRFEHGRRQEDYSRLVAPEGKIPANITALTGLARRHFQGAPTFASMAPELARAIGEVDFVVAYNAPFDRAFLANALSRLGVELPATPWVDPLVLIRELDRDQTARMNLRAVCKRHGIETRATHRALADAKAAAELLLRLGRKLAVIAGGAPSLGDVLALQAQLRVRQRVEREAKRRRQERESSEEVHLR